MSTYYFDVHDGDDCPDDCGVDLPDMAAAEMEALRLSGELLSEHSAAAGPGLALVVGIRSNEVGVVARVELTARVLRRPVPANDNGGSMTRRPLLLDA